MKRILLIVSILVFVGMGAVMPRGGETRTGKAGAGPGPGPTPTPTAESLETVKEFLLTSAATDFYEHQPPFPAKFRKVKLGYVGDTTKSGSWRLCGEFLPAEDGRPSGQASRRSRPPATSNTSARTQTTVPIRRSSGTKQTFPPR